MQIRLADVLELQLQVSGSASPAQLFRRIAGSTWKNARLISIDSGAVKCT